MSDENIRNKDDDIDDDDDNAAYASSAAENGASFVAKRAESPKAAANERECVGFKRRMYLFVKRLFDIVSSALLFLLFSPIMCIVLLVKWLEDIDKKYCKLEIKEVDDDGKRHRNRYRSKDGKLYECKVVKDPEKSHGGKRSPVYSSIRVGKGGKEFKFLKIRSMYPGAEVMKGQLIAAGLNEAAEPTFKIKNDPRITRVGSFLRKTGFDEWPQLLNIFVGHMSVVGPRPPLPEEVEKYTPEQWHRLDVKGGLLCLWQTQKDRNSKTFDEWVRLDMKYIEEQSILVDIKIIIKGFYMAVFDQSGE